MRSPIIAVVDAATDSFFAMIAEQRASNTGGGDHFAKPGANDRIWNALEKLCLRDPRAVRRLLRQRDHRAGQRGVARARLPDDVADQRRQSRRRGAVARIATITWDSRRADGIARYPGACASAVAGADAARRGRPLRHAGREAGRRCTCRISQTYVPGYLASAQAGVQRLFRQAPRAAAARQGRCGVLQSGAVPRRRQQPHRAT